MNEALALILMEIKELEGIKKGAISKSDKRPCLVAPVLLRSVYEERSWAYLDSYLTRHKLLTHQNGEIKNPSPNGEGFSISSGPCWARTSDHLIMSQVL